MRPASAFNNPYFVLVMATVFWGGNAIAGKLASQDWQPFTVTFTRWLIVAIVLIPFAKDHIRKDWPVIRKNWVILCLLSAFSMALFNLLMYLALHFTSAINVSIEQASMPAMIMLANFLILSQRITFLQIIGLLASIIGVLIICTGGDISSLFRHGVNRGDAYMLLACAFYAAYTFGLRWRPDLHWLSFIWVLAIGASAMSLPWAAWEWQTTGITVPGMSGWLVLIYIVVFPTIVSQIFYARGVQLIGGNRAGLFINLVPIFGSLLAILILREKFHFFHGIGLILVVGGIMLAERFASS